MRLIEQGKNAHILMWGDKEVLFSYNTAVGIKDNRSNDAVVLATTSQTTKVQITKWLAGTPAKKVDEAWILEALREKETNTSERETAPVDQEYSLTT